MGAHQHLEHAEHIGHAGGHGHGDGHGHGGHAPGGSPNLGRNIGVTMAVMGVLLAFSSAMVGGERTELVAAMIERTNASAQHQAASTKYRVLQAQLQQLHASMPVDLAEFKRIDAEIDRIEAEVSVDAPSAAVLKVMRAEMRRVLGTAIPARADLLRFTSLIHRYARERDAAHRWSESYEHAVALHERGAQRYEYATLVSEVGIVMASIALLLHSRRAWLTAILFGVAGVTILALTASSVHSALHEAEHRIHEAHHAFVSASSDEADERADERLLRDSTGMPPEPETPEGPGPGGAGHGEVGHGAAPGSAHGEGHGRQH